MALIFDKILNKIKHNQLRKKQGKDNSILFPFPRFSAKFPGWEKGTYYCITANSGIGKTKLTKFLTVLSVYEKFKASSDLQLKIFYFALEESKEKFWLSIVSAMLYEKFGTELSPAELESLGTFIVPDEIIDQIQQCREICADMERYIEVVDHVFNPTGIYKYVRRFFEDSSIGEEVTDPTQQNSMGYQYKNDNLWVYVVTDHVSLLSNEVVGGTLMQQHQTMGFFSREYCLKKFCKKFHCVTINVQQQEAALVN